MKSIILLVAGGLLLSAPASAKIKELVLKQDITLRLDTYGEYFRFSTEQDKFGCLLDAYVPVLSEPSADEIIIRKGSPLSVVETKSKEKDFARDGSGKQLIVSLISAQLPPEDAYLVVRCQQEGRVAWLSDTPKAKEALDLYSDYVSEEGSLVSRVRRKALWDQIDSL